MEIEEFSQIFYGFQFHIRLSLLTGTCCLPCAHQISEVGRLVDGGHDGPALLLGWAILEAQARLLNRERLQLPQTPGRIIDTLAFEGQILPNEADELRQLSRKRNALAHGDLSVAIRHAELDRLLKILGSLREEVPA